MYQGSPYLVLDPTERVELRFEDDLRGGMCVKAVIYSALGMYIGTVSMTTEQFDQLSLDALAIQREIDDWRDTLNSEETA
jgi:hypothetical protein